MDWNRIEELLEDARQLPAEAQDAFVADACRGDAELEAELSSLLQHLPAAETLFAELRTAVDLASQEAPAPSLEGSRLGRYDVLARTGAGGMGEVYEGFDRDLERRVALKCLPAAEEPGQSRSLLLAEARAIAALDHPNVCGVYEVGETPEGRPFIAMPFTKGLRWMS